MADKVLKNRVAIGNAIDKTVYERLQKYHKETDIPISKILDKALTEYLDKVESRRL